MQLQQISKAKTKGEDDVKKRVSIVLSIIALFAVTFSLVACDNGSIGGFATMIKYANADKYLVGSQTYTDAITSVKVDWAFGEVILVQTDGTTASVEEAADGLTEDQRVRSYVDGNTLRIKFWKSGYSATLENPSLKTVTVTIPSLPGELDVEAASATIQAKGKLQAAVLELSSTSGMIEVDELTATSVDLETTSGSITASKITASAMDLDSMSGSIDVGEIVVDGGDVDCDTSSGSIKLDKITARKVDVESTSGKIKLGEVICNSIECDSSSASQTVGKLQCATKAEFTCTSGSIEVLQAEVNTISADTSSGTVEVELKAFISADLESTSGNVDISLKCGAKAYIKTTSGSKNIKLAHSDENGYALIGDGTGTLNIKTTSGNVTIK